MIPNTQGLTVVSAFDGMRCGALALNRAEVAIKEYYALEVDKHAIKAARTVYPKGVDMGDVRRARYFDFPPTVDLLIGGSPCQGFSMAGAGLNFKDPRSALFFEFVRLLKELEPRYFLLENVRMKREYQDQISALLGVEPLLINSNLVSAQNRPRLYWTNIPGATVPEDREIALYDILEHDAPKEYLDRYNISEKHRERLRLSSDVPKGFSAVDPVKAVCMLSRQYASWKGTFITNGDNIRKLTPIECGRLQTIPDQVIKDILAAGVSHTQVYKMLGNGWTIDVIAHLFKGLRP